MAGFLGEFGRFGFGLDVVVTATLPPTKQVQFRKPRSKSRRIRRKWAKRLENWHTVVCGPEMVRMGNTVLCSPAAYARLQAEVFRG